MWRGVTGFNIFFLSLECVSVKIFFIPARSNKQALCLKYGKKSCTYNSFPRTNLPISTEHSTHSLCGRNLTCLTWEYIILSPSSPHPSITYQSWRRRVTNGLLDTIRPGRGSVGHPWHAVILQEQYNDVRVKINKEIQRVFFPAQPVWEIIRQGSPRLTAR
jgi:hypothetical protein